MDARVISDDLTDAERYPTLTEAGRRMLEFMREHPHAPIYRNSSGNRLNAEEVARLRETEAEVLTAKIAWTPQSPPAWLANFVAQCRSDVPAYRRITTTETSAFQSLPTISRADLSRDIATFVPDSVSLDRLINFRTSGTSGHPLLLASHPLVAGSYLAFHKRALQRFGITLTHGRGQMGVVLIGYQQRCFTYVSITPTMNESGLAKINLHPTDWRDPADRAHYLNALNPEIYTGDPLSFSELLALPLTTQPRALLSTSMTLSEGLRKKLEQRFQCPVLDIYSMNEAGPIAVADPSVGGHVLLQNRLYVEILDTEGNVLSPGQRGEVTVTGGFNFCLPLLRYRTGDYAALSFDHATPVLLGFEGRPPVRFRTGRGEWLNNIEVTHALGTYTFAQYTLHQYADGRVQFRCARPLCDLVAARQTLQTLLGQPIDFQEVTHFEGKIIQYTSDLPQE